MLVAMADLVMMADALCSDEASYAASRCRSPTAPVLSSFLPVQPIII